MMRIHNSDYSVERFSMGRLQGAELADFEVHLLQCSECQDAVCGMDLYLQSMRGAAERTHAGPVPGLPARARLQGEYLLVKATFPDTHTENIGVLLLDGSDRLYCRFRRDFDVFVAHLADRFAHLPNDIQEKANELGARECLKWLQSTFSTVQISGPMKVLIGDYATTVDRLYTKHIHPNIMRFCTHLPRYSLEAAAGKFGKQMAVEPEGWVEVRTDIPLTGDMFVTHVKGHSMEPRIPDASLCAFRSKIAGSWDGKVLLLEQYGEAGGNRYTVKRCRVSKDADPTLKTDEAWLHQRVTLESINPEYKSWDVASSAKIRAWGEFLFVL
jgi:Peptidase S24-like